MISTRETISGGMTGRVLAATATLLAGCVDPPAGPPETTASQTLASMPNAPAIMPPLCPQRPYCIFKPAQGSDANTGQFPLWSSLGCGLIYDFEAGSGFGLGALCADSTKNRGLLHAHGLSGFEPGGCEPVPPGGMPCLNLPPGLIFVVFEPKEPDPSPFCPSTCAGTQSPQAF